MSPKEKAEKLVSSFKPMVYPFAPGSGHLTGTECEDTKLDGAKLCAIMSVDEIIRLADRPDLFKMRTKRQHMNNSPVDETYVEYWVEVKKEIEKL